MLKKKLLNPDPTVSGFTLLETLIVILLIAILTSIAAPGWLGYLNRQRVSRARSELAQALEQAQTDAQQQNGTRVVAISSNNPPRLEISSTPGEDGNIIELGDQNEGLFIDAGPVAAGAAVASVTFDIKGTVDQTFIFSVTSDRLGPNQDRCVIVATLLGNLVQAEGDDCDLARYTEPND